MEVKHFYVVSRPTSSLYLPSCSFIPQGQNVLLLSPYPKKLCNTLIPIYYEENVPILINFNIPFSSTVPINTRVNIRISWSDMDEIKINLFPYL